MNHRYQQLAVELAQQIDTGVYAHGVRLPGVRALCAQRGVSVATVVAAYRKLEDEGYLEARPRSGFYVRARHTIAAIESAWGEAEAPRLVSHRDMAMTLIKAANDADMVQLGAAVPDASYLPMSAIARAEAQVMRRESSRAAGYMMPPGAPELTRQIARRMNEAGARVRAADIVITTGCQEALSLALRATTRPGDVVAVESPSFYGLLHALEALGLEALEIPVHPRDGLSLEALELALERWPVKACVVTPNFSNPLGACMPEIRRRALIALLARHHVPLIEDDVYGELGFSAIQPLSCKALAPTADILYCSSFSKSLAPGLRVGWIAAGARHAEVEYLKYVTSIATPSLPQLVVAELLENGRFDRHLREVRGHYARAVARMSEAVMRLFPDGTRISQPQGGFVLWLELPDTRVDSFELARCALTRGVSIAPGALFSASGKYANYLRLSCARPWDAALERALATLAGLA